MATRTAEQSAEFVRELLKYALEVRGLAHTGLYMMLFDTSRIAGLGWCAQQQFLVRL